MSLLFTLLLPLLAATPAPAAPPREVMDRTYLFEVVRYLYRWHLDERDVEKHTAATTFPFRVRGLDLKLDEGDRSQFAEIDLPLFGMRVRVKKADYRIEETGFVVSSRIFRVVNVAKLELPAEPAPGDVVIDADMAAMRQWLFETRFQGEFPEGELKERIRRAARKAAGLDAEGHEAGAQTAFLAPLSPVANECWFYWETGKRLFRISSDIDLSNPEVWDHEEMSARVYDVLNQVVVSMDEAAGSNEFLTRDQVGRALFNCVVLGRRLDTVNPPTP